MPQPIELYYWPTPNGHKISIALEEMAMPYVLKPVNIGAGEQFKPGFLALSPNNRMPAILDPEGPGGPISVFESGAILQYLGRKTGKFYPVDDERGQVEVEQWLFWQMAGLGPMAGQAGHFQIYAPSITPDSRHTAYGANRYVNEVHRLCGVMERRLADRDYLAGNYSIADVACWPWISSRVRYGMALDDFPRLADWFARIADRPAVQRGMEVGAELRNTASTDNTPEGEKARQLLFGQRAR